MSSATDKVEEAAANAPSTKAVVEDAQKDRLQDVDEEDEEEKPLAEILEDAKRSFALRKWDEAVDGYGRALEVLSQDRAEDDPVLAPLHHRYGHALLEHAIATSGALGGGGGGKDAPMPSRNGGGATTVASARAQESNAKGKGQQQSSSSSSAAAASKPSDPRFTFGGDAEESDEEDENNAGAGGADDDDDDDDLGDAFAVLELARVRYEKLVEEGGTLDTLDGERWSTLIVKGQLAEVLNDLADVGLESENFQQASSDYRSALELLEPLLQPHSRRLADANLRLGLALEFHPDASVQASAETYVTAACMILKRRLEALERRKAVLQRQRDGDHPGLADAVEAAEQIRAEKVAEETAERLQEEGVLAPSNGKGKAVETSDDAAKLEKDDVVAMDWQAVEKELRDMQEMVRELELKLEEYANAPPGANGAGAGASSVSTDSTAAGSILESAETKAALKQAINEALLGASTNSISSSSSSNGNGGISTTFGAARTADPNVQVNDLSAMVKKKKRAPPPSSNEQEASSSSVSKKARVEDDVSS